MAIHKSKWFLPGFSLLLGLIIAVAFWIGDEPGEALWALGIMSGFGLLVLVGGRFELIRGLRGDGRDEYWERIDIHATALTGLFPDLPRHRDVHLGVGARPGRLALRATRCDHRPRVHRGCRLPEVAIVSASRSK